jgi:tetratricopeptide (TPR) repeat protein
MCGPGRSATRFSIAIVFAALGLAAVSGFLAARALPAQSTAPQSTSPPTFARDVAPILYRSCSNCHRPSESGPFPLLSYDDAKKFAPQIAVAVSSRAMPPWLPASGFGDFANDPRLTDDEIRAIVSWARAGAPEGSPADAPPPPNFVEGWQLGQPDLVLEATQAFNVPSTGPDVFWNFIFSPQLTSKRYVRAIEVRPGIPHGVHHANLLIDPARSARAREKEPGYGFPGMDLTVQHSVLDFDGHFLFWKPGGAPWVEPNGLSWELDPGADLVLNAHIMTMGMPMGVRPEIGLYFTNQPPTKFPLLVELERDQKLDIPPGAKDFTVGDDFKLPMDVDILAVYPHAHYLGHVLEAWATLPTGEKKWLIKIPGWDPNWQAVYHYREPLTLPKGSVISMRWHFDNSAANPRNPHKPPQRVVGGNQSTDEMAHFWLQVLPRNGTDRRAELQQAVMLHNIDKNPRDYWSRVWLGALMLSNFDPTDAVGALETAVALNPKEPEGRNWLGLAFNAVGRKQEAVAQFRDAISLRPDFLNARLNLVRTLTKMNRLDEATTEIAPLLAVAPSDVDVLRAHANVLLQSGKPTEAVATLRKALEIAPTNEPLQEDLHDAEAKLAAPSQP